MAMTVLAIGGAGVIAMQKASVQGNDDARKLDVANSIAREWVDRLQRDTSKWTLPDASNPTGNNIDRAKLLSGHVTGDWYFPNDYIANGMSPGFDMLGRDLETAKLGDAQFCVHVRLAWLVQNEMVRAEVRVFWPRGLGVAPPATFCAADNLAVTGKTDVYHFVQVVTALRRSAGQ